MLFTISRRESVIRFSSIPPCCSRKCSFALRTILSCRESANSCAALRPAIEEAVLNSGEVCTDAATVTTNGRQSYSFLNGMNHARKELAARGICAFTEDKLVQYEARYDEIIVTAGNRTKKQGEGLPEKKKGHQMYCDIMSAVGTVKRKKLNIFQRIIAILKGTPVIG